jgi:hypothetical protein
MTVTSTKSRLEKRVYGEPMSMGPSRKTEIYLGLVFCGALFALVGFGMDQTAAEGTNILWSADHEEGDLSDWYVNTGGGEVNSGNAVSVASRDVAHAGSWSVKATITTPPVAGVRLFRLPESKTNDQLHYSAWYYFPEVFRPVWWNIFQFKSRPASDGPSDPFWTVNVGNRSDGSMALFLQWWGELWTLRGIDGPHQGEFGWYRYTQSIKNVPVGQWVHIEVFLRQSDRFDGQIIVWQDGVELANQNNIKTRYPFVSTAFGAAEWSINNYSESILPSPATIYFDDAVISLTRVGPGGIAPRPPTNLRILP